MSDKFITPEKFCDAWKEVWADKWSVEREEILEKYTGRHGDSLLSVRGWTGFMLTDNNSFLDCVAEELGFQSDCRKTNCYQGEYDRCDMALLSDYRNGYPIKLDVLIEHENDKCPENEMWKLMLRRSPLKVIVFYHHDFKHMPPKSGNITLPEKLDELREMLTDANNAFPENEKTEYLFIIGKLNDENEIFWRWATDKQKELRELC